VALATTVWLAAPAALAQDGPTPPPVVDVILAVEENGDALEGVIVELLDGLDVEVRPARADAIDPRDVVEPPADPEPALARVWIAPGETAAVVYLADAPWERVLVRRVPLPGGLDEVAREQLAQIVHTAVEALQAGARIGLSRAEARETLVPEEPEPEPEPEQPEPEPEPEPPPPPPPPSIASMDVALGYVLSFWANGPRLSHGPSARGTVRIGRGPLRPLVALGLGFRPTQTSETGRLRLDRRSLEVRLEVGLESRMDSRTRLRLSAGLTIDVTEVEPREQPEGGVVPARATDTVTPLASVRLGVRRTLWEGLWAGAGVLLDVDLVDTRYVILASGDEEVALDPWTMRPSVWLEIGWAFP